MRNRSKKRSIMGKNKGANRYILYIHHYTQHKVKREKKRRKKVVMALETKVKKRIEKGKKNEGETNKRL